MQLEYATDGKPAGPKRRQQHRTRRKPIDGRTRIAKRIRQLTAGYLVALGERASLPRMRDRCERTAQLVAIAEDARRKALAGAAISFEDLVRVENTAERAVRGLGLDRFDKPKSEFSPYRHRLELQAKAAVAVGAES